MDGSSSNGGGGGGNDGGGRRNLAYAERFKDQLATLSKEAQALAEISKPYREEAREQIKRALPASIPTYQTLTGVSREKLLAHGEGLIAAIAGTNGTSLEQSQAQAIADSLTANARSTALLEWGLFGGTLLLAYRHRRRIPAPVLARGGTIAKFVWPPALFLMYSIPVSLFAQPGVLVANAKYHATKLQKDPRLAGLQVDLNKVFRANAADRARNPGSERATSVTSRIQQQSDSQTTSPWSDYSDKEKSPSWDSSNQSKTSSQDAHSGWDDDDASPIALSAKSSRTDSGLSAWDRIRSEKNQGPNQSRQTSQNNRPTASWGSDSSSGSASSDSYSFGSTEQERSGPKDQAQREFDRLVDQDRQGYDQKGSWVKR